MNVYFTNHKSIQWIAIILIALVTVSIAVVSAKAQTTSQGSVSMPDTMEDGVTIIQDKNLGKYLSSNLKNLSKLYWRLGAYDTQDIQSIANYIQINECTIYNQYKNNDIEWKKIVTSMQSYLEKESQNFSLDYQFILQLSLGAYDSKRGGFEIKNSSDFNNTKLILVNNSVTQEKNCSDARIPKNYPKDVMILLDKPFTMDFVEMNEHIAQAYILKHSNPKNRVAYMRLRVSFDQYVGNLRGKNSAVYAVMGGKIDGYEIFDTSDEKNLLFSNDSLTVSENDRFPIETIKGTSETRMMKKRDETFSLPKASFPARDVMTGFAPTQNAQ